MLRSLVLLSSFACALVLGIVPAHAQVTKVGDDYLFRQKLKSGLVIRYNTKVTTDAMGDAAHPMVLTVPIVQKIGKIVRGIADVNVSIQPIQYNGKKLGGPATTVSFKLDTRGQVVGGSLRGMPQGVTVFPKNPIHPGQAWRGGVSTQDLGVTATTSAVYRFVKIGTLNGKQVAVLRVLLQGSEKLAISGTGYTYISVADGLLLRTDLDMQLKPSGKTGQPLNMKMVVTRS